jgi:hypothetical protein
VRCASDDGLAVTVGLMLAIDSERVASLAELAVGIVGEPVSSFCGQSPFKSAKLLLSDQGCRMCCCTLFLSFVLCDSSALFSLLCSKEVHAKNLLLQGWGKTTPVSRSGSVRAGRDPCALPRAQWRGNSRPYRHHCSRRARCVCEVVDGDHCALRCAEAFQERRGAPFLGLRVRLEHVDDGSRGGGVV